MRENFSSTEREFFLVRKISSVLNVSLFVNFESLYMNGREMIILTNVLDAWPVHDFIPIMKHHHQLLFACLNYLGVGLSSYVDHS